MGFMFVIYMFLSNYPSSRDINSSNLPCFSCILSSADFFQNHLFEKKKYQEYHQSVNQF